MGIPGRHLSLIAFALLLLAAPVRGEVLVLVHGYLGSANSWVEPGIIEILESRGHQLAGTYYPAADGVRLYSTGVEAERPVYTVNLPSLAPIGFQADWLAAFLRDIRARHPESDITLAGHSAGGLVARMVLVRDRPQGVTHLITIATPHLGTWRANQVLDLTSHDGMFGPIHRWAVRRRVGRPLYNTLRASRGVLRDLAPARPGNLLFWLNRQPHPEIRYTSIIRTGTFRMPGDQLVPPRSQDMRLVPPLRERANSFVMAQGHMLTPQDGHLLANLLDLAADGELP